MIYSNALMKSYLMRRAERGLDLNSKLGDILRRGVRDYGGALIFEEFLTPNVKAVIDARNGLDYSYYEYSTNKLHLEDYVNDEVYSVALAFSKEFASRWIAENRGRCVTILSFQDSGEFSGGAVFTFYIPRNDQPQVVDLAALDEFERPILVNAI